MINKNNVHLLRFINIILLAVTIIFQYNCNFSLKISSANPMLPICLLVAICMFCSELTAALSGLVVGVFIDSTAATIQGFNAIMFLIIGLATSLIVKHLFNNIKRTMFHVKPRLFYCVYKFVWAIHCFTWNIGK